MPPMTTARPKPDHPTTAAPGVPPARRLLAFATDLIYGGLASLLAASAAGGWLLLRTGWGRDDVPSGDATFASALLLAATPAWLAWTAIRLAQRGATPGQARCGLRVVGRPRRRLLRLAAHPLSVPGWLWLAILAAIATFEVLAIACAAAGLAVLLGGLVTAGTALLRPRARGLHDFIARTRLVTA